MPQVKLQLTDALPSGSGGFRCEIGRMHSSRTGRHNRLASLPLLVILVFIPTSSSLSHAKNINWRPNAAHVIVDLHFYEPSRHVHKISEIRKPRKFLPNPLLVFRRPNVEYGEPAWAIGDSRTLMAFNVYVYIIRQWLPYQKLSVVKNQPTVQQAEKIRVSKRFARCDLLKKVGRFCPHPSNMICNFALGFSLKCDQLVLKRTAPAIYFSQDGKHIVASYETLDGSVYGDEHVSKLSDLAHRRGARAIVIRGLTVRSGSNLTRRSYNKHRRSVRRLPVDGWRTRKESEKQYKPRWIRTRVIGAQWSYVSGKDWIGDLRGQDIDVSDDGRSWFHLLGPHCLGRLPVITRGSRLRMMSLTRQRRKQRSVRMLFGSKDVIKAKP